MKYCAYCGKELFDEAVVCPSCGCATDMVVAPKEEEKPSSGFKFLGFFFPVVGLVLYIVFKNKKPLLAKYAGIGALIGAIVSAVCSILYYVLYIAIMFFISMLPYMDIL